MIINWWAAEQLAIEELLDIKLNYYKKPGSEFVHPWFDPDMMPKIDYNTLKKSIENKMDTNNQAGLVGGLKTSGLTFNEAMKAMHSGYKVRLPEWTGYWFIQNKEMSLLTRTGDILTTPDFKKFGSRDDWEIAIQGLGFDFAILALKSGKLLARGVWADRMVFMRPSHAMTAGYVLNTDQSLPGTLKSWLKGRFTQSQEALGIGALDKELEPINLSGYLCSLDIKNNIMNGWTPSQDDMFASDWGVVQVPEWQPSTDHPGLGSGSGTQELNPNLEKA